MKRVLVTLQDSAAQLLGLDPKNRTPLVRGMLHRPRGDAAGYWLQLVIATVLATLGLALDSTAVVIGAMLIAPLMRPIVELAMGLATGSPPLVLRTGVRAVASVAVVVMASAAFAWLLPFHEVTPELLARTAPSILDLFVAGACALAGAYAVVIASSEMATTAAGTSIGISLVPPLCTAGYGVSIGDWDMAIGAGLLFTANVTGIITVASALFVVVGFGQVDIREEERSLDDDVNIGAATRIGRRVSHRSNKLGASARLVVPLVVLGAIAFPLMKAVDEMSRRANIRQRVTAMMNDTEDRIVQFSLDERSRPMVVRVVVVGDPSTAHDMELRLRGELEALGERNPTIFVWAVSDATAVSALSARLDSVPTNLAPPPPPPPPPPLDARIRKAWPAGAGDLLSVWIADGTPPRARVTHLLPPAANDLGEAGRQLLATTVAIDDVRPVIEEATLQEIEIDASGVPIWLPRAIALLERASEFPELRLCVTTPPVPARRVRVDPIEELVRALIDHEAATRSNIEIAIGERWKVTPQRKDCGTESVPTP